MLRSPKIIALLISLSLFAFANVAEAAARFDVSYLWHSSVGSVKAYKKKIGRILGSGTAKRLRIVKKRKLYGLIYRHRGSIRQARRIARKHSRILRARRLPKAAPIRSQRWRFIGTSRPRKSQVAQSLPSFEEDIKIVENKQGGQEQFLTQAVEKYVAKLRKKGLIARDERTAWSVYDFATGKKLVSINENLQLQAASLIKPFIALAYFHEKKRGEVTYDKKAKHHMRRMIQRSNNHSTNWVMRQLGGPLEVGALLKVNYPEIFQDIDLVEYIPRGGRTYRNKASANDYSRFLLALWKNKLPNTRELKRLMSLPGPDRLYTRVKSVPRGTKVYNKTGSTAHLCGDMGILVVKGKRGKRYAYTLVGIIEKQSAAGHYGRWIRSRGDVIRMVSNIVYRGIKRYHHKHTL